MYDALSSERPYKQAWTPEQVVAELLAERGRQLDPQVVSALLELLEEPLSQDVYGFSSESIKTEQASEIDDG